MRINIRDFKSVNDRRTALEKETKSKLPNIGKYSLNEDVASTRNCENMIGVSQVPMGIAGPLLVRGDKEYFIPLATTEGALIASVSRGMKAITESGGVKIISEKVGITRGPVFQVKNIEEGRRISEWVVKNFERIQKICEATSSHLTLIDINPFLSGRSLFLRFRFDTMDAMGMNMATIASTQAAHFMEKETQAKLISASGNVCIDKKPNNINFVLGRGFKIWADVLLSEDVVVKVLKTSPKKIEEVFKRKVMLGSILSGAIGANAQMANVLAAVFLATGQDLGHIAEVSSGVTSVELMPYNKLYISVYLPDLPVGTVGGGTGLATQHEALSILGIAGGNSGKNAKKLAEIIGGAVLAGELSLLASLAEGSLAKAHQRLARGK